MIASCGGILLMTALMVRLPLLARSVSNSLSSHSMAIYRSLLCVGTSALTNLIYTVSIFAVHLHDSYSLRRAHRKFILMDFGIVWLDLCESSRSGSYAWANLLHQLIRAYNELRRCFTIHVHSNENQLISRKCLGGAPGSPTVMEHNV